MNDRKMAPAKEKMDMRNVYIPLTLMAFVVILAGCVTTPTQQGAAAGAAIGAGVGAIIGNQSGDPVTGALIGAGAGGLAGALIGDQVDEHRNRQVAPPPAPAPVVSTPPPQRGHYESRVVHAANGETYEERVWVPDR